MTKRSTKQITGPGIGGHMPGVQEVPLESSRVEARRNFLAVSAISLSPA
jgi:hypothetical protein